jgi:hypothetical protein
MHAASHVRQASLAPEQFQTPKKQNFMRLPIWIDGGKLLRDFAAIPDSAWGVSHWDVHCSIDVLLLRGGDRGEAADFFTQDIKNNPVLEKLPYIASLLEPNGPFGGAVYAFIFKTKPNGITRAHRDKKEEWHRAVRIHIPIVTNPGAFLLAEGRAKHLEVGEAWTFDNQSTHAVVNGDATRVHLIIDVNPNPKLIALMSGATIDPGEPDPERWQRAAAHLAARPAHLKIAQEKPLSLQEKKERGVAVDGFATRIVRVNFMGRLLGTPLRPGDILLSVNGVKSHAEARSVLDHIRMTARPGETVTLGILRQGRQIERQMRIWPDYYHPRIAVDRILHRGKSTVGKY